MQPARCAPGTTLVRHGACAHDVVAGKWVDPYTGAGLALDDLKDQTQAQRVQIDHVVPLLAWPLPTTLSAAQTWEPRLHPRRILSGSMLDGDQVCAVSVPVTAHPVLFAPR